MAAAEGRELLGVKKRAKNVAINPRFESGLKMEHEIWLASKGVKSQSIYYNLCPSDKN